MKVIESSKVKFSLTMNKWNQMTVILLGQLIASVLNIDHGLDFLESSTQQILI